MDRVAYVKNESATSVMIVGKEHPAGWHCVFRVMHQHRLLIRRKSSHQVSIRWRGWIGIDHRKKVVTFLRPIASPDKKVVTWGVGVLLRRLSKTIDGIESNDERIYRARDGKPCDRYTSNEFAGMTVHMGHVATFASRRLAP